MRLFQFIIDKLTGKTKIASRVQLFGAIKCSTTGLVTEAPSGMAYAKTKNHKQLLVRLPRGNEELIHKMIDEELDRLAWPTRHVSVVAHEDHYRVDVGRGALTWLRAEDVLLALMKLPSGSGHKEVSRVLHKLSQV